MCHLALDYPALIPVIINVPLSSELYNLFNKAMEPWNRWRHMFEWTIDSCNAAEIIPSGSTWVDMDKMILRWAPETDSYWAIHELGHLLGLADHVYDGINKSKYRNPGGCDGYKGVMSYCWPKETWFGQDDYDMINTHWPLDNKITIPGVANG